MVDNLFFLFDLVLQVSPIESLHSISPSPPRPSRPSSIASERAQVKGLPKRPHPPNGSHPVRPSRPESTRSGETALPSPSLHSLTVTQRPQQVRDISHPHPLVRSDLICISIGQIHFATGSRQRLSLLDSRA